MTELDCLRAEGPPFDAELAFSQSLVWFVHWRELKPGYADDLEMMMSFWQPLDRNLPN